jgi:2-polyprenyl-3-methyl-5-hydroxy-6-metoxy-1,4-benzoquinol methylase
LAARTIGGLHDFVEHEFTRFVTSPSSVLDLGGGTGAWASRLVSLGHNVTCVDQDLAGFALESTPIIQADLNGDFADRISGAFSAITAIEVIEHLENPRHFLRQCMALLDDDGIILITTPNIECVSGRLRFLLRGTFRMFDEDDRFNEPTHISPIQTYMFTKMIKDVGLSLVFHGTSDSSSQISRPVTRLVRFIVTPFLSGTKGGDIHIFVLSKQESL